MKDRSGASRFQRLRERQARRLCENSMPNLVFRGKVILPATLLPDGVVIVDNERIVSVGRTQDVKVPDGAMIIDAADGYVSPGFVDIHTHGGAGSDYMDGTPEAVRISNRAHARHGTTTIFPTTTTGTGTAHRDARRG